MYTCPVLVNSSTAGDDSHSGYTTVSPLLCSCNISLSLYFFVSTNDVCLQPYLLNLQRHFVAITMVTGILSLVIDTFGESRSSSLQCGLDLLLLATSPLCIVYMKGSDLSRSTFQRSNPIGQYIIHNYIHICAIALTTP